MPGGGHHRERAHTPILLFPRIFRKGESQPQVPLQLVPRLLGRGLSAHTALPLPDCRRPWCAWVDTSSWEDQAFFRRSGL